MRIAHQTFALARPQSDLEIGSLSRTQQAPARLPVRSGYRRTPRYAPAIPTILIVAIIAIVIVMVAGAGHIHGAAGNQGHHTYCK